MLRIAHVIALSSACSSLLFAQNAMTARDLFLRKTSVNSIGGAATKPLAIRYTLLSVDPTTDRATPVDPQTYFHTGDCVAIEVTSNQNAELYVLNHGSTGKWGILIPDPHHPDADAGVSANKTRRVPQGFCFQIDDKPGTEVLVLAVAASDASRDSAPARAGSAFPAAGSDTAPYLDHVRADVETWLRLGSRDLKIEKIEHNQSPDEPAHSVYAAFPAEANRKLVVEITVQHR
jgi:Domain of unknown function (DUF4384)